ncbi:MAG TPA: helix-turn-helix transcriptional regulator [Thermomicrobiales bacterium]|nr:helix-turn-helix transcriptional regulator [Thermomicrobiales bacterium]
MSTTPNDTVPDSIPNRLRARIADAYGGNQRAFAAAMGLSPQHVSALLSGKIATPRPEVRRALARELGMTHGEFLVLAGELAADEIVRQPRPLPSDEAEIVRLYRELPPPTRKALLAIVRELAHQFAADAAADLAGRPRAANGAADVDRDPRQGAPLAARPVSGSNGARRAMAKGSD